MKTHRKNGPGITHHFIFCFLFLQILFIEISSPSKKPEMKEVFNFVIEVIAGIDNKIKAQS